MDRLNSNSQVTAGAPSVVASRAYDQVGNRTMLAADLIENGQTRYDYFNSYGYDKVNRPVYVGSQQFRGSGPSYNFIQQKSFYTAYNALSQPVANSRYENLNGGDAATRSATTRSAKGCRIVLAKSGNPSNTVSSNTVSPTDPLPPTPHQRGLTPLIWPEPCRCETIAPYTPPANPEIKAPKTALPED